MTFVPALLQGHHSPRAPLAAAAPFQTLRYIFCNQQVADCPTVLSFIVNGCKKKKKKEEGKGKEKNSTTL